MARSPRPWLARTPRTVLVTLVLVACGARTSLDALAPVDASTAHGSGADGAVSDGAPFVDGHPHVDVQPPPDASLDVSPPFDVTPPFDSSDAVPPIDAIPPSDAASCGESGTVVAYLVSDVGQLYTVDPPSATTTLLGTPACPITSAWTMSVSRTGVAFIVYQDFNIYRVDLTTLACTLTPYTQGQLGLVPQIGLAVSRGTTESLFYYGQSGGSPVLATSDLSTFVLSQVGVVTPDPGVFPLDTQADEFGRLFGLSSNGVLVDVDTTTAFVLGQDTTSFNAGSGWAVLTYKDQIYFYGGSPATEYRYDLASKVLTTIGTLGFVVVGASAAPCQ